MAGSAGFSATAPSPDALRFGSSAGASTTLVGEALPSTEVLAFLAATTGSAAAGAALVFSARAGDDMVACARRRRGGAAMAWTGRIDLRTGGIRRAAAGRRFVACAGNEVRKQRSGALRLRRRVCVARALRRGGGRRAAQILAAVEFGAISSARLSRGATGVGAFRVCQGRARAGAASCGVFMCVYTGADKRHRNASRDARQKTIWLADAKACTTPTPHLSRTH